MADQALIQQALQALEALKGDQSVDPSIVDQCIQAVQSQAGQPSPDPMGGAMPPEVPGNEGEEAAMPPEQGEMPQGPPPRDAFAGARQAVMQHAQENQGELPDSKKGREEKKKKAKAY
jgi:hypothetical protein